MHQDSYRDATPSRPEATSAASDWANAGNRSGSMDAQAEASVLEDRWNFRLIV